jgi:D-alanyl-D-alanine dipeptidase
MTAENPPNTFHSIETEPNVADIVNINEYGIKGINYYWNRKDMFNITDAELRECGVEGDFAYVKEELIEPLQAANDDLRELGMGIIVKDGYRSPALYKLVKQKRYEIDGKANTDRTLNSEAMPHASGYVVDVNLYDLETSEELSLWDKKDWPEGAFVDFYRDKTDEKSINFQKLQSLLIQTMVDNGFELGSKNEFWHFGLEQSKDA